MREILFRGKRIDNGKWIEGLYCQRKEKVFGGIRTRYMIVVPTVDSISGARWIAIDLATAGQYTGLTDKNGKKIFEGDIVEVQFPSAKAIGKVIFENGNYIVRYTSKMFNSLYYLIEKREVKVVGNIHDNPKLLKGEGNDT